MPPPKPECQLIEEIFTNVDLKLGVLLLESVIAGIKTLLSGKKVVTIALGDIKTMYFDFLHYIRFIV